MGEFKSNSAAPSLDPFYPTGSNGQVLNFDQSIRVYPMAPE